MYFTLQMNEQWHVLFGKTSPDNAQLHEYYEVTVTDNFSYPFLVDHFQPFRVLHGTALTISQVLQSAMSSVTFSADADSYNYLAVLEPGSVVTAYFYPVSMNSDHEQLGADTIIRVSSDGTKSIEIVHAPLFTVPKKRSNEPAALWTHTHRSGVHLSPLDVFYLLRAKEKRTLVFCFPMDMKEDGTKARLLFHQTGWGYLLDSSQGILAVRFDPGEIEAKTLLDLMTSADFPE